MSGIVGMIDLQISILIIWYTDWGLFLLESGYERAFANKKYVGKIGGKKMNKTHRFTDQAQI